MLQTGEYELTENVELHKENELFDNHRQSARYDGPLEIAPTVVSSYGTGGLNTPFVKSYCIAANSINRKDKNGGNGTGVSEDLTYTLTQTDIHAVFHGGTYQDKVGALMARDHKGINEISMNQNKCILNVYGENSYAGYGKPFAPITASGGSLGGGSENLAVQYNLVRRLTPLECERLMGFPDGWTDVNNAKDTPRYKALGNSIVVPCLEFIFENLVSVHNQELLERGDSYSI